MDGLPWETTQSSVRGGEGKARRRDRGNQQRSDLSKSISRGCLPLPSLRPRERESRYCRSHCIRRVVGGLFALRNALTLEIQHRGILCVAVLEARGDDVHFCRRGGVEEEGDGVPRSFGVGPGGVKGVVQHRRLLVQVK